MEVRSEQSDRSAESFTEALFTVALISMLIVDIAEINTVGLTRRLDAEWLIIRKHFVSTTAIYLQARPNHRRKAYKAAGFDELLDPC